MESTASCSIIGTRVSECLRGGGWPMTADSEGVWLMVKLRVRTGECGSDICAKGVGAVKGRKVGEIVGSRLGVAGSEGLGHSVGVSIGC